MQIIRAEISKIRVPFQFSFKHALAERSEGECIIVRLEDDAGHVGFGECVPRDYVTGESLDGVQAELRQRLLPPLLEVRFESLEEVAAHLVAQIGQLARDQHAAFCAAELAALDLAGRAFDRPVSDLLGPVCNPELRYSAIISADEPESAVSQCTLARRLGFTAVKLKVGLSHENDLAILEQAREVLGDECSIRVDANCAWTAEQALENIESFAPFRLDGIEQPTEASDLDGLSWLTERSPAPIILDESLVSLEDAQILAERKACHVFNIRISKCGGLLSSVRIRDVARMAGIDCMMGAQVGETAVLSAAGRAFAASSEGLLFLEGSYGSLLLEKDIGLAGITIGPGGVARPLAGPGLGVEIDEEALGSRVTERTLV